MGELGITDQAEPMVESGMARAFIYPTVAVFCFLLLMGTRMDGFSFEEAHQAAAIREAAQKVGMTCNAAPVNEHIEHLPTMRKEFYLGVLDNHLILAGCRH